MATSTPNQVFDYTHILKNPECIKIGIVVSEWNTEITDSLYAACHKALSNAGILNTNIVKYTVPGSYELPFGAQLLIEKEDVNAVISLGCVVKGETPHFDYICQSVAHSISSVSLKFNIPVIFGVLTTLNQQQALDRAGGKYGNKGEEAAITALKMLAIM